MRDCWVLSGAEVARGPKTKERLDLEICSGKISAITPPGERRSKGRYLDLSGCLILPGLINAHEHLEFSLFPRLGKGTYQSAADWARDIYHPAESPIREHLLVPLSVRLRWGAVKNLLSGVTTVCEHNPYREHVFSRNFGVRVPRRYGWAHSFDFTSDLREKYQRTPKDWPFVLHLGEATKRESKREIHQLDAIGALNQRTVLVHAVALGTRGFHLVSKRGGSIVWCPTSNFFILGRTLADTVHKSGIRMALGTDSALSGEGNLLDEIRFANMRCGVSGTRLYDMVTRNPARIMRLLEGQGTLREGGCADLLVIRGAATQNPASALLRLRTGEMEMVFVRGKVKLASKNILKQLPVSLRRCMHRIQIEGMRCGVFIAVQLRPLLQKTAPSLGSLYLAHKKIKAQ
jgi:cytosine/adenosine deaminase-related metal-dependent hydrolase